MSSITLKGWIGPKPIDLTIEIPETTIEEASHAGQTTAVFVASFYTTLCDTAPTILTRVTKALPTLHKAVAAFQEAIEKLK